MDSVEITVDVLRICIVVLCLIEVDICSDVGDTSGVLFLRFVVESDVCGFGSLLVVGIDGAFDLSCTVLSGNAVCLSSAVDIVGSESLPMITTKYIHYYCNCNKFFNFHFTFKYFILLS